MSSHRPKVRFPDNIIKAALVRVESSKDDFREHARTRGANAGRAWVLSLFGFNSEVPAAERKLTDGAFGLSMPGVHLKPTKLAFARGLAATIETLEKQHGFCTNDGWGPIARKDIAIHEAYGFCDALEQLADRFDLWELLSKGTEDDQPPEFDLYVFKSTLDAGSCNFCPARTAVVYEVGSKVRTLKVRMCPECIKAFRDQTKGVR